APSAARLRLPVRRRAHGARLPPARAAHAPAGQPGQPPGAAAARRARARPRAPLRPEGQARRRAVHPLAAAQHARRLLGQLPLREVGRARGVAARREPRGRLAPRRLEPGRRTDRAGPHRAPARTRHRRHAARARPPHGPRGDHLGLLVLGHRDAAVHALLAVLRQGRDAAQARRQDGRAPRPHPLRAVQARRRGAHDVLAL
ncbi:MAG: hypothetical protein AVDCRST_MAG85-2823, partial [uncultured Solirubrobacteraceae bacterium]